MARGKIQMRRIESVTSRQVTFSKRRNGILKKAHELSVLCDAEVAVIIFSQKGRLSEFSSHGSIQNTIDRYQKHAKEVQNDRTIAEQYIEKLKEEVSNMSKKIDLLEDSQRKLLGQGLSSCSLEELQELAMKLETSLWNVRQQKAQLLKERIQQLKAKELFLIEENAKLCEQCGAKPWPQPTQHEEGTTFISRSSNNNLEVETDELFIGRLREIRFL